MQDWKIFCEEDDFPGLWRRWFQNQCVAVGWSPQRGYALLGRAKRRGGWPAARKALREIREGDRIVVHLKNHRVGRLAEVIHSRIGDNEWDPLVPPTKRRPDGEIGRRVDVRWDLSIGPQDPDTVVKLPVGRRFSPSIARRTVTHLSRKTFKSIEQTMRDETNWVPLLSKFAYERSLSDYVATYPHRLEDGLLPHPDKKVRENVFGNRSRSDVLLIDRSEIPVVVECKQHSPRLKDIRQLRGYMMRVRKETNRKARGILVHGGARKLRREIRREAQRSPRVEIVQYVLSVAFAPCI